MALNPGTGVELLIPDFNAKPVLLDEVFAVAEVLAHNIETVPRIFKQIRPGFRYDRSMDVIRQARSAGLVTKSNLILGMGEEAEVSAPCGPARRWLRPAHDLTQYLRPSVRHRSASRCAEEFVELNREAEALGFVGVHRATGAILLPRRPVVRAGDGGARGQRLIA